MSAYKFVTREEVQKQFKDLANATEGVRGSAIIIGLAAHMRHLCEHAIAERDAYREVAQSLIWSDEINHPHNVNSGRKWNDGFGPQNYPSDEDKFDTVDAEAARLIEGKK